eukprot:jgi/Botrbrau1/4993/Bobra.0396s0019.1
MPWLKNQESKWKTPIALWLISNKAADMAKKVAQHRGTEGPRECVQLLRRLFSRPGQPNAEGSGTFSWTDFSEAIERYFQPCHLESLA